MVGPVAPRGGAFFVSEAEGMKVKQIATGIAVGLATLYLWNIVIAPRLDVASNPEIF